MTAQQDVAASSPLFSLERFEAYSSFMRMSFLTMLAYRLRYFTGILTYVLFVSVHYFIWKAVYSGLPADARINGFTLGEMITYVAVGWISRSFYFSNIDDEIDELVRSGQISVYLLRPVNFHLMMLSQAAGESLFRILFFSAPICIAVVTFFPVSLPPTFTDAARFFLSTASSFLILAEVNFAVGLLSFRLKSIQGIARAKYTLIQLLSGLFMPLAFFPGWFRTVVDYLPFKLISYVPLQFYLGKVSGDQIGEVFLNQVFWIVTLVGLSHYFFVRAMRRLTLQGG
ncbi:MAG: ABC-2 family transporter protein [Bdellovibrionota bacterium]